ncbi:MAG TPA: SDR family oxidoreductase [Solirubrobacteraceae bacterium]|nr:SDR family oxidoreductase [Solirubrobacteraceae bacterium]
MSEQSNGGVALVTGANRGIGREVARQLAVRGYEVLLSARDGEKARTAAEELTRSTGGSVLPLTLDVSDPQSISAAAERVRAEPGRLDVLVNNAGIGSDFGVAGAEPDFAAIQRALDTNFYGAYRLTIELLGLLRESAHPRIVNVSSGMGGVAEMGGWSPGYRVSKAALNATTRILATELKDAGFLVNSACPGFVNTDMGGPMGATKPVEDGAAGIVWLATLPDDGPSGGFFRDRRPVAF